MAAEDYQEYLRKRSMAMKTGEAPSGVAPTFMPQYKTAAETATARGQTGFVPDAPYNPVEAPRTVKMTSDFRKIGYDPNTAPTFGPVRALANSLVGQAVGQGLTNLSMTPEQRGQAAAARYQARMEPTATAATAATIPRPMASIPTATVPSVAATTPVDQNKGVFARGVRQPMTGGFSDIAKDAFNYQEKAAADFGESQGWVRLPGQAYQRTEQVLAPAYTQPSGASQADIDAAKARYAEFMKPSGRKMSEDLGVQSGETRKQAEARIGGVRASQREAAQMASAERMKGMETKATVEAAQAAERGKQQAAQLGAETTKSVAEIEKQWRENVASKGQGQATADMVLAFAKLGETATNEEKSALIKRAMELAGGKQGGGQADQIGGVKTIKRKAADGSVWEYSADGKPIRRVS
jgi:hypothetical protein